ncbi:MAG: D-alanine--D-alanine ligase, partial [Nanoarchaeota archaeon]
MRIGTIYNLTENSISENEITQTLEGVMSALEPEHEVIPLRVRKDNLHLLTKNNFDFVFNLAEGFGQNSEGESWIASYLELQEIPYTGSNPSTLALCLDKAKAKAVLLANNLPTPKHRVFTFPQKEIFGLEFPLIVKPVHE